MGNMFSPTPSNPPTSFYLKVIFAYSKSQIVKKRFNATFPLLAWHQQLGKVDQKSLLSVMPLPTPRPGYA